LCVAKVSPLVLVKMSKFDFQMFVISWNSRSSGLLTTSKHNHKKCVYPVHAAG